MVMTSVIGRSVPLPPPAGRRRSNTNLLLVALRRPIRGGQSNRSESEQNTVAIIPEKLLPDRGRLIDWLSKQIEPRPLLVVVL